MKQADIIDILLFLANKPVSMRFLYAIMQLMKEEETQQESEGKKSKA